MWTKRLLLASLVLVVFSFACPESDAARHYRLEIEKPSPVLPGPRLRDSEFFAMLDLSGSQRSLIAEAVRNKDYRLARSRLMAYFRKRSFDEVLRVMPYYWNRETADLAMKNTVEFRGLLTFPSAIDWNYRNREMGMDISHYLNRHHILVSLAGAYRESGDREYARKCVELLDDWIERCPRDAPAAGESAWLSLNTDIRLVSWIYLFDALRHSSAFGENEQIQFLKSLVEQTDYLATGIDQQTGNWAYFEANALIAVSAAFPEFKQSTAWRNKALSRLEFLAQEEIYPDGLNLELSPGYQAIMVQMLFQIFQLLEAGEKASSPDAIPKSLREAEENMLDAVCRLLRPDGTLPRWNDTQGSYPENLLPLTDYLNRPDLRNILTRGASGRPPLGLSRRYAYGGYHVMRDGWGPDARYLCFDAGPAGVTGHVNEDKLGIDLHAFGTDLLPISGPYLYSNDPIAEYLRWESRGRNTLTVDGKGQKRRDNPGACRNYGPLDNNWYSSPDFDYASGEYRDGYGDIPAGAVVHKRRIFFVRGEYWIIEDWITGSSAHTVQSNFQLGPAEVRLSPNGVLNTLNEQGNLAIACVGSAPMRAVVRKGSRNPVYGWTSLKWQEVIPAPHITYESSTGLPLRITTILYPYKGTTSPGIGLRQIPLDRTDAGRTTALEIRIKMPGTMPVRDLVLMRHESGKEMIRFEGLETDALMAYMRQDEHRSSLRSFTFGGSFLRSIASGSKP